MAGERSREIMSASSRLLPGGVDSPVRSFAAVGGDPPVFRSAQGAHLVDEDGRRFIYHVLAYGPHLLGHGNPAVLAALHRQLDTGIALGGPTQLELALAQRVTAMVPSIEMVRFVNSGTEACMSALRLARGATGRSLVVKCAGGYHGHADLLLVEAGSGVATLGIPGSPGVTSGAVADTLVVPYNDASALRALIEQRGEEIAAVIIEPVAGNMGCVPPLPGYLAEVRRLTSGCGALLILDEVMTGFRVARGGAQELFNVSPDITCLGKILGGGLPIGAFGGRAALMAQMAPTGPIYQAGTLSGNSLAMAAGCAMLDQLDGAVYARLEQLGGQLERGFAAAATAAGIPCVVNRVGSMVTPFIGVEEVTNFEQARRAGTARYAAMHRALIEAGVFWPPSQFEAGFVSTAHTDDDLALTVEAFGRGLRAA
jgi:glutamate-1-semialdehyde 2,1-aminomutase